MTTKYPECVIFVGTVLFLFLIKSNIKSFAHVCTQFRTTNTYIYKRFAGCYYSLIFLVESNLSSQLHVQCNRNSGKESRENQHKQSVYV